MPINAITARNLFRFTIFIFCFAINQPLNAQSNPNRTKTDTTSSYYDKEAFEKELKELLGIKDEPKKEDAFITQVKYLIGSGTKNFKDIIIRSSLKAKNGDSTYSSTYKIDGASNIIISSDKLGFISYDADLYIDNNNSDAVTHSNQVLEKLRNHFGTDYTFQKLDLGVDFNRTIHIKKKKNKDGIDMLLSVTALSGKYTTSFTVRKEAAFVDYSAEWGN